MPASLLLINTKHAYNVGAALRAASCYGAQSVYWTGNRVSLDVGKGERLPREERMKAYQETELIHLGTTHRPIDDTGLCGYTPVAVELLPGTTPLHEYPHPLNALYIFGPEDSTLSPGIRSACHEFIQIPSYHCLNLAAACYVTLYSRAVDMWTRFDEPMPVLNETRGVWHTSELEER